MNVHLTMNVKNITVIEAMKSKIVFPSLKCFLREIPISAVTCMINQHGL